jgi:hypothetical protein
LPGRGYKLYEGSVFAGLEIYEHAVAELFTARPPSLFWSDTKSICVATEIDFDSTLAGGPERLISEILLDNRLEAWAVEPKDSLRFDADTYN